MSAIVFLLPVGMHGSFTTPGVNIQTGELVGTGTSSNVEVVLVSDILDETGNKVGELQKVLPDAIHKWEQFLSSKGLTLRDLR